MKIERSRLKKSSSEVPLDCRLLVERLKSCSQEELLLELQAVKSWNWGKCELYHWIDVLDLFDSLLEAACHTGPEGHWCLHCDRPGCEQEKELLLCILQFTALLIEHSFSRHLYNSMEHLTALLSSSDMQVVLGVLNLLYVFSKRSNFITRLNPDRRQALLTRLTYLAENWGGKENGFGLADCCQDLPMSQFPASATTLHFEFYVEPSDLAGAKKQPVNSVSVIHMENVDKVTNKNPSQIMEELLETYAVPPAKHMLLLTHIRLAHSFSSYAKRLQCVQARLQALSILVYCSAIQDNINSLLYNGLIEELVDVLELKDPSLIEIKAASLRTLTSIIHLDRNPKLGAIVDATGAASYHGFLPVLVRGCIQSLTEPSSEPFPLPFATALFSFLYHLASYESGGEALVSCGMVESLLKVIGWHGTEPEHITFVTRAVRVIDLITGLDMQTFQAHGGLNSFIRRLELEVEHCRKEQPFAIRPRHREASVASTDEGAAQEPMEVDHSPHHGEPPAASSSARGDLDSMEGPALGPSDPDEEQPDVRRGVQCFPQRAALLKSMLNFLKKAIQDPSFADSIRHLMDGSLPRSLKHIISNSEYYGPSLFLLATDVVTVYVFQEPSLLSSLQDNGLTDVVLRALLVKEVPATREVLASLPNVFSALCLNARGLQAFVACRPFERLFKVLLSPDYLAAMRRRRSSDPMGDTASNLGNAMDELMRHQPSLRVDATAAIIKLLEELCSVGRNPAFVCSRPAAKSEAAGGVPGSGSQASATPGGAGVGAGGRGSGLANDAGSSDEEEEEEDVDPAPTVPSTPKAADEGKASAAAASEARIPVPLVDYILNVMRFVDAILSNNSTDDHCREFVQQKGLVPLMGILGLPNLPVDFPVSPACQAVASVCKSILNLAHEAQVLQQGLSHLGAVLSSLEPLHRPLDPPGGSVLLEELLGALQATASATTTTEGGEGGGPAGVAPPTATTQQQSPLLHAMAATHAYIVMFVHVCRTGQSEIRSISMSHWGSELGLSVLRGLSRLYTSLVWESTVLLALCNDAALPPGCPFGRHQLQRLQGTLQNLPEGGTSLEDSPSPPQNGAMEVDLVVDSPSPSSMEGGKGKAPRSQAAVKQIKPLLTGASRLGRALAELFGLLVKLCVGSPMRQRRGQQVPPSPTAPSPSARAVASALTRLLANGLSWEPPLTSPMPKFRLTFYICSVGFTSPMLFDERKYPYHLMLQRFLSSGGQDAFFETFRWALTCGGQVPLAEGLESPELPEGTGEFLDAWLMLLEKMVNPRMVLESPHTLPSPGVPSFSPVLYLVQTQRRAFEAVMQLWDRRPLRVYGDRMSESMLAILCHLLRGEALVREKLAKEKEAAAPSSGTAAAAVDSPLLQGSAGRSSGASRGGPPLAAPPHEEVNQDHLQQLMDMGFCRELATEALVHSASLEQATDYLLSHPAPLLPPPAAAASSGGGAGGSPTLLGQPLADLPGSDLEMSEEDQMMRAIAMSLGENVAAAGQAAQQLGKEGDDGAVASQQQHEEDDARVQAEEEPVEASVMDGFTEHMLPGCLRLLDALPETVYRVCDLLGAVVARNGTAWRDRMLAALLLEVRSTVAALLEAAGRQEVPQAERAAQLATLPVAGMAAVRIHLFTLLFEEMRLPCAALLEEHIDLLVQLADAAHRVLVLPPPATTSDTTDTPSKEPPPATPKWLVSLILLIDLYEKASVASKRRAPLLQLPKRQWKWFDDRTGRWNTYTAQNNKAIDDAYCAVEPSVHFTAGRRKYTVQFSTMVQINEETGNWRPVMLAWDGKPPTTPAASASDGSSSAAEAGPLDPASSSAAAAASSAAGGSPGVPVRGLAPEQCSTLVRACVGLLSLPVEPDTLHGVLRLSLRLTRCHEAAQAFAALGGPRLLLGLTQASAFAGFASLASLLVRHVVEEPPTLAHAMDKVARTLTAAQGSPVSSKELHYVLRVLGPAACRDARLFQEVATGVLRISLLPMTKRAEEEESRYTSSSAVQLVKSVAAKGPPSPPPVGEVVSQVMSDLLNVLPTPLPVATAPPADEAAAEAPPGPAEREGAPTDLLDEEAVPVLDPSGEDKPATARGPFPSTKEDKSLPLLPKSAVCRLLAELVRSYAPCARIVAEHVYAAGQTELVPEEMSALGFVLDQLLPQCQTAGDKDSPALARVLVAALASANHSPDTQTALVNEVKAALQRALALPETADKHARIQALTGLVGTMIESCPPASGQGAAAQSSSFRQLHASMNNMVRVLLRRGLVTDLARIPHSLDLSSPHMAATVNSALKPLETLSRIVNLPSAQGPPHPRGGRKGSAQGPGSALAASGQGAAVGPSPAGATSSRTPLSAHEEEGHEDDEDGHGGPEHRDDGGPPPLEAVPRNSEMSSSEATNAYGEVTVDDNTDSESHAVPEEAVVVCSDGGAVLNEADGVDLVGIVDALLDRDHDAAPVLDGGLTGRAELALRVEVQEDSQRDMEEVHQETTDSESNSDSGRSEDEAEQDEENEDEGDEEAEDEDEDEEEYQDLEEALFRMQDRDDNLFFHFEEVFPSSGTSIMFGGSEGIRTYQLPIVPDESNNGAETTSPSIPPPPGTVASTHPLLVRHGDPQGGGGGGAAGGPSSRLHRRTRGFRAQGATHGASSGTWHVYANRHPNPPAILQRLLGPNTAQDILQLTSTFNPVASSTAQTRVVFANSDFRILATDEDLFEIQDPGTFVSSSGTGTLSNVPTALVRWTEESRVLDGDSMHDCVAGLKPAILEVLEKHRDEELAERREKRRKLQQQEAPSSSLAPTTVRADDEEPPGGEGHGADSSGERTVTLLAPWPSSTAPTADASRSLPPTDLEDASSLATTAGAGQAAGSACTPPQQSSAPETVPGSEPSSLAGTERLAASIVERVLGPALSMTGAAEPAASLPAPPGPGVPPMSWLEGLGSTALSAVTSALQQSSSCTGALFSSQACPMDTSEETSSSLSSAPPAPPPVIATAAAPLPAEEDLEDAQNLSTDEGDTASPDVRETTAIVEDVASDGSQQPVEEAEEEAAVSGVAAQRAVDAPGPSVSNDYSSILGDVEIPEGVDPSFLAALPENIRQEVIAEQLRLQRLRSRAQQQQQQAPGGAPAAGPADGAAAATFTEVNPEFLAALPPSIQEEVLAQQRAEQQRLAAQNPDAPVDPASFIQTLPPGLRQQVLADMDDSLLALLPSELASEAHSLRRELEARHRAMQERFFSSHGGTALSRILRSAAGRMGTRYTIHTVPHHRGQWTWNALSSSSRGGGPTLGGSSAAALGPGGPPAQQARGRQLLDHEALACLLVLLFVDEPRLNTGRLHRVLRNLCYHPPTRHWVVKSLLSILEKTKENRPLEAPLQQQPGGRAGGKKWGKGVPQAQQPSWLSISLDAALGCRTSVFQIMRPCGGRRPSPQVAIHPQASPVVCRHVLDTLISLAKSFPVHFLPEKVRGGGPAGRGAPRGPASQRPAPLAAEPGRDGDFWSVLVRLDCNATGKRTPKAAPPPAEEEGTTGSFESSPLAQLISLLAHPVVKRSSVLTDRLLRLLALVSMAIPDQEKEGGKQQPPPPLPPPAAAPANSAAAMAAALDLDGALLGRATEVPSCSRHEQQRPPTTAAEAPVASPALVVVPQPAGGEKEEAMDEESPQLESVVLEQHLKLAVETLTSKACSEEGLEDATSLLLRLSRGCPSARQVVLRLLLEGARALGATVEASIGALLAELRTLNARLASERRALEESERDDASAGSPAPQLTTTGGGPSSVAAGGRAGTIQDRFTHSTVVITAPGGGPLGGVAGGAAAGRLPKGGRELQLPSMGALTSKMSSQAFFLRVLKVVIQLREAAWGAAGSSSQQQQAARRRLSGACDLATSGEPLAFSWSSDSVVASTPRAESSPCPVPPSRMDVDASAPGGSGQQQSPLGFQPANSSTPIHPAGTSGPEEGGGPSSAGGEEPAPLSEELRLDSLWSTLSDCLLELADTQDQHAVLVLQPAVEAFFLVHASAPPASSSTAGGGSGAPALRGEASRRREYRSESRETQLAHIHQEMAPLSPLPTQQQQEGNGGATPGTERTAADVLHPDVHKFLAFAERHRTVLNQILRQSSTPLADGPFAVLVDHTRVLDFDVKRRYFRHELERLDEGSRREDLAVHVRREHVFEDSFRELHRRPPEEWKNRFYIVFEGEEGQDAGGLLREWYTIVSREIFNAMYALFTTSPGDRVTYMINPASHCNSNHLSYFKFVGRIIAKAVYDNKLLECYFTRSFYKHILGKPVKYTDMESEDYAFYQGLVFLLEHGVRALGYELTFSVEVQEFGVTEVRDLKPGGRHIPVTEETTQEYVRLVCQEKMTGAIRRQLNAFLEGFYEIIPKRLIGIFNEQELELLISGLPSIDVDDLRAHTEYHKYQATSLQVQWFWRALRSLDQADRAKFLQFVTGTSKVPLQGFAALEGMNGAQRFQIHRDDRSTDRLPSAHTCFNQLDLPAYETYDKLRTMLLKAIQECTEGFGFA